MKITQRNNEELFVYYYDGKPMSLTPQGYDWRPPKKIFYKLGVARANPPSHSAMRKAGLDPAKLTIVRYAPNAPTGQVFDTYYPEYIWHDTKARPWTYKVNLRDSTFEIFDDSRKAQKRVKELRKEQEKYDMEVYNGR